MKAPLTDAGAGLAQIKAAVRGQAAYTLTAPGSRRKLNQNENPYDLPAALKREILDRAAALPWNRYPEFAPTSLLAALAARYDWPADGILTGNGSNELIQATLATALDAGDRVVAPTPTFSLYRLLTNVLGGRYVPVAFGPEFRYGIESLIAVAVREQARVIVLNSPNNPTGSALPDDGVERILDATDALVVCDEAYQDFGGPTALGLLASSPRVVVLRTFSKAYGAAGLRFGVALAHPAVAREIAKAKLPYNVNTITLAAAEVLLRHPEVREAQIGEIVATRDRTVARLRAIGGLTVYPSAANFVLIRCHAVPAAEVFRRLVEEHGILVRDVSAAAELAECLRISIGTPDDMDAVVAALTAVFEGGP
ncbi:MAG TPA: histidinol-phosphate transaminase [Gemmatimonadales bacterium]|nr:histidinol-phosphate transaminase [Gemmatimonadales bacterium]